MRHEFPLYVFLLAFAAYTVLLFFISWMTSKKAGSNSFFSGDRKAPWFVVAYGMVGTSISGVTFVSVPGNVLAQNFYYMPLVFVLAPGAFLVLGYLMVLFNKFVKK